MTRYYQYSNGQIIKPNGDVASLFDAELLLKAYASLMPAYQHQGVEGLSNSLKAAIEQFKQDIAK